MIYLDTNIIISFIDELDIDHKRAISLLSKLSNKLIVSRLTLIELASVYARARLENPVSLALYSIKKVGGEELSFYFNKVFGRALKIAPTLKLRTLDLLHIAISLEVGAKYFATFDNSIINKKDLLKEIGIEVITD